MANDTTGFRSLVQQIQERNQVLEPAAPKRELREPRPPREMREPREQREPREPRRDLPRRTRNGRTDGMGTTFADPADRGPVAGTLLGRRWL